jgi:hypothetical protein
VLLSRNNDVGGYWGPGVIYSEVADLGNVLKIDLLSGKVAPDVPSAKKECRQFRKILELLLEKIGKSTACLSKAEIELRFETTGSLAPPRWGWRGFPFICVVTAVDYRGHEYSAMEVSRCEKHDPSRESRRAVKDEF